MVNPTDFAKILLLKSTTNEYLKDQVYAGLQPQFLGVPVVINTAVTAGTYLVGNFGLGTQMWIRENLSLEFFREDGTNVRDGFVTVRLQERIALTNYAPCNRSIVLIQFQIKRKPPKYWVAFLFIFVQKIAQ
jgi:HK97 family phage major capsid protein